MNDENMNFLVSFLLPFFLVSSIISFTLGIRFRKNKLKKLKKEYEDSLLGSDKSYALECGRRYFEFYSQTNRITIDIESRIANDMATMVSKVTVVNIDNKNEEQLSNSSSRFCSQCGKPYKHNESSKFCSSCGCMLSE
jgi:NADH pyrophosphatase NudC (nudix superfamily)